MDTTSPAGLERSTVTASKASCSAPAARIVDFDSDSVRATIANEDQQGAIRGKSHAPRSLGVIVGFEQHLTIRHTPDAEVPAGAAERVGTQDGDLGTIRREEEIRGGSSIDGEIGLGDVGEPI
jgi:hypothetical protein